MEHISLLMSFFGVVTEDAILHLGVVTIGDKAMGHFEVEAFGDTMLASLTFSTLTSGISTSLESSFNGSRILREASATILLNVVIFLLLINMLLRTFAEQRDTCLVGSLHVISSSIIHTGM